MSKLEDRLMQFEELPKKKKKGKILAIGIALFVILALIVSVIKREEIANFFEERAEKEPEKVDINDILDEFKVYDSESGLVVPQPKNEYDYSNTYENISIGAKSVQASLRGYDIVLRFKLNRFNDDIHVRLKKVYIDDYVTDVEGFEFNLTDASVPYERTVTIKKTELDELGFNDFNKITLLVDYSKVDRFGQTKQYYKCIDVYMNQVIPVDHSKQGLIRLDNAGGVQFNFDKLVTDKTDYYLYFDLLETNKSSSSIHVAHRVSVNKLAIADQVFDVSETVEVYTAGRKLYRVRIPKKDVDKMENVSISFMVKNYIENQVSGYYLSNQIHFEV